MKKFIYLAFIIASSALYAGENLLNPLANPGTGGFLNSARMSMQNQLLMSYSSLRPGMTGMYLNTVSYRMSQPLTLQMHLGASYNPIDSKNSKNALTGFSLFYNPAKDMNIVVDYGNPMTALNDPNKKALSFLLNKGFFNNALRVSVYYNQVK